MALCIPTYVHFLKDTLLGSNNQNPNGGYQTTHNWLDGSFTPKPIDFTILSYQYIEIETYVCKYKDFYERVGEHA